MAALTFLKANPVLIPLVAVVTAGVGGGLLFGAHYLANNQDVTVNKNSPHPWNMVRQDQNSKLFSWNQDFWNSRVGLPDPRRALVSEDDAAALEHHTRKAKAIAYLDRTQNKEAKKLG